MNSPTLRTAAVAVLALAIVNLGFVSSAQAGIVATETMVTTDREGNLAAIHTQLDRADVRAEFAKLGVDEAAIDQRIANLSDHELATLSKQMEGAPAGGDVLIIIGIVFVVLVILEWVGAIDIFKKNP